MYSNSCCSCSFQAEIIKLGQSSYKMYSNNILNFQVSTTILNAHTKMSGEIIVCSSYIYIYIYIYIERERERERNIEREEGESVRLKDRIDMDMLVCMHISGACKFYMRVYGVRYCSFHFFVNECLFVPMFFF